MAALPTRKPRMRFASNTSRFILLLALIAATSFRCNGDASEINSMFALAAEQMNHNEGGRGSILRTDSAELEGKGEDACHDSDAYTKRDKDGNRHALCEWAALKPNRLEKRCKKKIRRKNPEGKGKINILVSEECGCTCKDVEVEPPTDPDTPVSPIDQTKVSCPTTMYPETSLQGGECPTPGQSCGYRYLAFGCTQAEYQCTPIVECKCYTSQYWPTARWQCSTLMQPGPTECPGVRPFPENFEEPPSNVGQTCDPEENTGSAEDPDENTGSAEDPEANAGSTQDPPPTDSDTIST